jgi:hypothetical protein
LVNAILVHVVSNISGVEVDVGIVPEFRMDSTRFDYTATSYGGVVDFMIVKGPPASMRCSPDSVCILCSFHHHPRRILTRRTSARVYGPGYGQSLRVTKPRKMGLGMQGCHGRCVILSTTQVSTFDIFSETRLSMASIASQRLGAASQMVKSGCFSSSMRLTLARVSISDEFDLGEDLSGLPPVLGLLSDWVNFIRCFSLFERPTCQF